MLILDDGHGCLCVSYLGKIIEKTEQLLKGLNCHINVMVFMLMTYSHV